MEISNDSPEWAAEDITALRNFLKTTTGQRLFTNLTSVVPMLLAGGETNAIMIRSGEVRGIQLAVKTILELAYPPKVEPDAARTDYPPLTDDKAWNDGQKLETK